jgi:hypothetical protein
MPAIPIAAIDVEDADDAHAQPKPLPRRIRQHMESNRIAPNTRERKPE